MTYLVLVMRSMIDLMTQIVMKMISVNMKRIHFQHTISILMPLPVVFTQGRQEAD